MKRNLTTGLILLCLLLGHAVPALSPAASASTAPSTAAAAGMGVILWLICGGLTVLLVFALFIARAIKKRKGPRE